MNFDQQIESQGYCIIDIDASQHKSQETIATQYNILIMCHCGNASVEVNTQRISIIERDCMNLANVVLMRPLSMSNDFKASVLLTSRDFSLEATMGIPTEYLEPLFHNPVTHIEKDEDWFIIKNCFENLSLMQQRQLLVKHKETTTSMLRSILLTLIDLNIQANGEPATTHFSQADLYFRHFISLIHDNVKKEHEVAFYGNKLNISPKYLSTISKQKCGLNAKEVISTYLVARIKRDILLSGKSIKTIAYDYGFADQSSLAKFFNKMTGQSPTLFKEQNS